MVRSLGKTHAIGYSRAKPHLRCRFTAFNAVNHARVTPLHVTQGHRGGGGRLRLLDTGGRWGTRLELLILGGDQSVEQRPGGAPEALAKKRRLLYPHGAGIVQQRIERSRGPALAPGLVLLYLHL